MNQDDTPGRELLDHLGRLKHEVDEAGIAESDAQLIRDHLGAMESEIQTAAFRARSGDLSQRQVYSAGLSMLTDAVVRRLPSG